MVGWNWAQKIRVRSAQIATPDGGTEIRVRPDEKSPWKSFLKVGPDEILNAISFTADGQSLFLMSSIGRDTAAGVQKNIASGAETMIASSEEVDAGDVVIHPRRYVVEAVAFRPGRTRWVVVDPAVENDFAALAKVNDGDFFIANRTEADDVWLVGFQSDRAPGRFYHWD